MRYKGCVSLCSRMKKLTSNFFGFKSGCCTYFLTASWANPIWLFIEDLTSTMHKIAFWKQCIWIQWIGNNTYPWKAVYVGGCTRVCVCALCGCGCGWGCGCALCGLALCGCTFSGCTLCGCGCGCARANSEDIRSPIDRPFVHVTSSRNGGREIILNLIFPRHPQGKKLVFVN